ncbi:hypothetical protein [Tropicibacter alexandrii]|uniref:hypothetical protein n=1 Tax=Tropicibacter alexandrii TaxID=2267683 RepID=UPI000EF52F98|nr:hypothetical protein [Tropicibacter alexandrii]
MAYFDNSYETRTTLRDRVARLFETPHDRKVRARAARIEALRALSDAELAARGIARDNIVMHVFSQRPAR